VKPTRTTLFLYSLHLAAKLASACFQVNEF
jgi:hypothetical protein